MISTFYNLRQAVVNLLAIDCYVNRLITVILHVFFNRRHLVPLFYSRYEPKFIKHMIPLCDCYAYETMF